MKDSVIVFCVYSHERVLRNRDKFVALFKLFFSLGAVRLVIVNNSTDRDLGRLVSDIALRVSNSEILSGSNDFAEFSAWAEGIRYADNKISGCSGYLLLNDTVFGNCSLYGLRIVGLLVDCIRSSKECTPLVIGIQIELDFDAEIVNIPYHHFIRTAIFYLSDSTKEHFLDACAKCFDTWKRSSLVGLDKESLLKNYFNSAGRRYISNWLFEGGWYKSTKFEAFDKNLLRIKLTAIACEHYFSAIVVASGGQLVNIGRRRTRDIWELIELVRAIGIAGITRILKIDIAQRVEEFRR